MKKCFIFSICGVCNEPTRIIDVCTELGYNAFVAFGNFHGELTSDETEKMRQHLIDMLIKENNTESLWKANYIKNNTKVMEITFI